MAPTLTTNLLENTEALQVIFSVAHDAIFLIDPQDERIVDANPSAAKLLGYRPDELRGIAVRTIHPEEMDIIHQLWSEVLDGAPVRTNRLTCTRKDQTSIPVEISFALATIDERAFLVAIVRDLVEEQRANTALLERQTRLALLHGISSGIMSGMSVEQIIDRTLRQLADHFTNLRVAYSTLDEHGQLTVTQSIEPPEMPSIVGMRADLSVAREYFDSLRQPKPFVVEDVTSDDRLVALRDAIRDEGGTHAMVDVPLYHSDQYVGILCFDSSVPRKWSEHEVTTLSEVADYLSVALKDAHTEKARRMAHDALIESEARYRSLYNETPVMMHSLDLERRIVSASDYWLKMLGYERDEVIGEPGLNFLTNSSRPQAQEILSGDYESLGVVEDLPLEFKKKDGGKLDVLLSSLNDFDDDGNIISRRAVLIDITDRRRLEIAILDISERERRRLGQDLHDDVLQTLHGVWLMSEKLRDELSDKHTEAADSAERISNLLHRTSDELRSLVRGLNVVDWSPDEFEHILTDLANDVERTHQADGVSCSVNVDDAIVLPDVQTATHLIRIAQEAIANAIKHGAATEIIIRLTWINGVMELTVRDNGRGIVLPVPESEGFGLRIMDYRARLIKGVLKVKRLDGGGTIVTCTCPLPG